MEMGLRERNKQCVILLTRTLRKSIALQTLSRRGMFRLEMESLSKEVRTMIQTERWENVFVIMPTGSANSLCVLLPTFMTRGVFSSILIVPLLSLAKEFEQRTMDLDLITCTTFHAPRGEKEDLYILTPQQLRSESFLKLISSLVRKDIENYADVISTSYILLSSSPYDERPNLDLQLVVLQYHGGMGTEIKERMYGLWCTPRYVRRKNDSFNAAKVVVLVCLCDFGAGIDAPNVSLVLQVGGSSSPKDYAKEAGRAGRDGDGGLFLVLYSEAYADYFQYHVESVDKETHSE
ncbi:unnamed protein product [Agarophyton chilense]